MTTASREAQDFVNSIRARIQHARDVAALNNQSTLKWSSFSITAEEVEGLIAYINHLESHSEAEKEAAYYEGRYGDSVDYKTYKEDRNETEKA